MKNKLITKIIIVAVCVSTLLVTFVVPSFAYTISNTSALYNTTGTFNLPGYNAINLKNVSDETDIPDVLSYPIADYYAGRETTVVGSFVSEISNTPGVSWSAMKTVDATNNYTTGYLQTGEVKLVSTATQFPFDYYEIDSIVLRDYRFDSPDVSKYTNSTSIELYLYNPELFSQINFKNDTTVYSLKVNYHYKYYDRDGDYHDDTFDNKIYGISGNDGSTRFYIRYFPKTYYRELGEAFANDDTAQNPIYTHNLVYLEELVITIDMDGYDINFMTDKNQSTQAIQKSVGRYTNRLFPSNVDSPADLISDAYDLGYKQGKDSGYDEGFRDAVEQGELNPFESVVNSVSTFLDWEFIPGVSVGIILSLVVGISLLITFLKIFAGG